MGYTYNLSALGSRIQLLIGSKPSVNNFYTSADLCAVINDACIDVSRDLLPLENSGSVWTTTTQSSYPLSASYMTNNMHVAIRAVFWNNYLLRRVAVDDAIFQYGGSTQPSQDPTRYRIWNNCIELPALPASAEELKVYYYYRPATLSNNGDVPGFGDEYAEAVIYLAASYLDCASNDDKKENKFYQRYLALQKRLQSLRIGFESNIIIPSDPLEVKHRQHGY